MTSKLESQFQSSLIKELHDLYPSSVILKNNPNNLTGIPDLIILWNDRWAVLECKRSAKSTFRPNQKWYIDSWNEMSFASVIFPENREEVLNALSTALRTSR